MDDLPADPLVRPPGPPASAAERCHYCGAPLNPFYYFCLVCGTPYKHFDTVITPATPEPLTEGELVRRKAPYASTLFWTFFATIVASAIVTELMFQEDRPDLKLFVQIGALFVTTCAFAVRFWTSLVSQFKRVGFDHPAAYVGLVLLVPTLVVNYAYTTILTRALRVENAMPLDALRQLGLSETTLVIVFCLYPAVTEEIAFRGLLQHWLQVAIKPMHALVVASFLFAVVHFSILSFPYLFGVGALLGWVKWKTGSLYPSMLIHFLHNLVVIEFF
jgi:membrane protease YdiL (CAAX protease family)